MSENHMKKVIFATLFLFAFSINSIGQVKSGSDGTSVYRDDMFPFSIVYPDDWSQKEPSSRNTRFKIVSLMGFGGADFSVIVTNPVEIKNLSSSDFANGLLNTPSK